MFKKINKKLSLIILGSIFVGIVLAVVTNQGVKATSSDGFCLSCHDAPEFVEQFEARSHAEVSCIDCHTKGLVKDKVEGTMKAFSTLAGQVDPNNYDELVSKGISDDKCLSCHNLENENRSQAFLSGHAIYAENNLSCTDCHDGPSIHGYLRDYSN